MLKKRRKRRSSYKIPEASLTPLIDTALTLLVIFMIAVPVVQNGIMLDLPQGSSKEVGAQQEAVVSINKDGKLFFNSYPIKRSSLVDSVKKAVVQRQDLPVYVRADQTLSYGQVIEIVDELKNAGVRYVAMSTRSAL